MAGVGRRGFAAVTRAAMVAASHSQLDSRRANAPKYLDLNTAMNHVMRGKRLPSTPLYHTSLVFIFLRPICNYMD